MYKYACGLIECADPSTPRHEMHQRRVRRSAVVLSRTSCRFFEIDMVMSDRGVKFVADRRKSAKDSELRHAGSSELLQALCGLVDSLVEALGPAYEVVVHDLSRLPNSVVGIAGSVTGRTAGSPPTNILLRAIREKKYDDLIGYRSDLPNGRILKSSTLFIKDLSGETVGCICFNQDITDLLGAKLALEGICATEPLQRACDDTSEYYAADPTRMLENLVDEAIKKAGQVPALMHKGQKLALVRYLEEKGAFLVKGAVRYVASVLGVSSCTVYSYVNEVRAEMQLNGDVVQPD